MSSQKFSKTECKIDAEGNGHYLSTLLRGNICIIDNITLDNLFKASIIWSARTSGGNIDGALWEFTVSIAGVPIKLFVTECSLTDVSIRSEAFDQSSIPHYRETAYIRAVDEMRAEFEKSAYILPLPAKLVTIMSKFLHGLRKTAYN